MATDVTKQMKTFTVLKTSRKSEVSVAYEMINEMQINLADFVRIREK